MTWYCTLGEISQGLDRRLGVYCNRLGMSLEFVTPQGSFGIILDGKPSQLIEALEAAHSVNTNGDPHVFSIQSAIGGRRRGVSGRIEDHHNGLFAIHAQFFVDDKEWAHLGQFEATVGTLALNDLRRCVLEYWFETDAREILRDMTMLRQTIRFR